MNLAQSSPCASPASESQARSAERGPMIVTDRAFPPPSPVDQPVEELIENH
jgi:hypothetical protein